MTFGTFAAVTIKAMAKIPAGDNDLDALLDRVTHHLQGLLNNASGAIAALGDGVWQGRTTLVVGATAGMRSLSNNLVDVGKKARIEHVARKYIHEYANAQGLDARFYATISGATEGQFGWAAVNYTPNTDDIDGVGTFTGAGDRVGYLEMGGQSMQVAFHSDLDDQDNARHFRRITIGGQVHNVFAREWKAHGIEATWASHNKRRTDAGGQYPAAAIVDGVVNPLQDNCIPQGAQETGVNGAGNFYACMQEALWHVRCGDLVPVLGCTQLANVANPCASGLHAGDNNALVPAAHRGCLIHNMPAHVQDHIHTAAITRWVGGSNFFYGAFGVFDEDTRTGYIAAIDGYQPPGCWVKPPGCTPGIRIQPRHKSLFRTILCNMQRA